MKHLLALRLSSLLIAVLLFLGLSAINGQTLPDFQKKGLAYFTFTIHDKSEISQLTRIISIDNVKDLQVFAFANEKEFNRFKILGYSWTLLPLPGDLLSYSELNMGNHQKDAFNRTIWNYYPTYQQYLDLMTGFATSYPAICKVDTIGVSIQGRLILAVKISDSVELNQGEPEVLLTSSIHGDEVTGYICMLHLIDSILSGYGTVPRMTNLVNNFQLYINPLANPDGTYHGGNNTVNGAWRYNSNMIDLNRNFPDPKVGPHPDLEAWQTETKWFMRYDTIHNFVLSMNFHGGAEVYNFPWDTWAKLHADDSWFGFTGREYADTVHANSPSWYFKDEDNGVTNGYAWYEVNGGRQDYTTYFHHGREVTLEISNTKILPSSQLLNYWGYNKRSFLNYIEQAGYGINGQVTDTVTGEAIEAKVFIQGHDKDNSDVSSHLPSGWYYRLIDQGSYNLTFSSPGYFTKTVHDVTVNRLNTNRQNVELVPLNFGIAEKNIADLKVYPNPADGVVNIIMPRGWSKESTLRLTTMTGKTIMETTRFQQQGNPYLQIDLHQYESGIYILELQQGEEIYRAKIVLR